MAAHLALGALPVGGGVAVLYERQVASDTVTACLRVRRELGRVFSWV